ncbi:MAG: hypothetical protein RL701_625 [Pseudomonadota bacterium]|jgi:GH24 family phage-related lysozyme (muramidase)
MARARIPGPIDDPDDLDLGGAAWPRRGSRGSFRFHMPDPTDMHRQPAMGVDLYIDRLDYEELLADLLIWESFVPYMYVDSVGVVTVGIGNALRKVDAAKKLPFVDVATGAPATEAQIEADFLRVSQIPMNQYHTKYRVRPGIEVAETFARDLAMKRLRKEFVPAARNKFLDFDRFPKPAQRLIVDMTYNGGPGLFDKRAMVELINERRWLEALLRVPHRGDQDRKAWREDLLRQAAQEDAEARTHGH